MQKPNRTMLTYRNVSVKIRHFCKNLFSHKAIKNTEFYLISPSIIIQVLHLSLSFVCFASPCEEELQQLEEYVIKAVRRSNSIGKSFTYKFYSGDECFKAKRIKQDQKVFGTYRSMILGEGEKIKNYSFYDLVFYKSYKSIKQVWCS